MPSNCAWWGNKRAIESIGSSGLFYMTAPQSTEKIWESPSSSIFET